MKCISLIRITKWSIKTPHYYIHFATKRRWFLNSALMESGQWVAKHVHFAKWPSFHSAVLSFSCRDTKCYPLMRQSNVLRCEFLVNFDGNRLPAATRHEVNFGSLFAVLFMLQCFTTTIDGFVMQLNLIFETTHPWYHQDTSCGEGEPTKIHHPTKGGQIHW